MKIALNKLTRDEKGQALILVVILMLLGSLIIAPLLGFMGTGLIVGKAFEERMDELYAADAGVEDGLWKIINDQIPAGSYPLTVNGKNVAVDIASIWILDGIEDPSNGQTPHSELIALGRIIDLATGRYEIQIRYDGTNGNVRVERIGIWLPAGYGYVPGTSSGITTADPVSSAERGGITLIWDLSPPELFRTNQVTIKSQFVNITPVGVDPPGDFAWIRTTRNDIYLSWDANFTSNTITATATDTATGKQTEVLVYMFKDTAGQVGIITWDITLQ